MTVTTTPRFGLTRWSANTDPFSRAQMDAAMAALDAGAAMFLEGTLAARPAAAKAGRLYRVTDAAAEAPTVFWDSGTTWVEIRPTLTAYATNAELDAAIATRSPNGHDHPASAITSGIFGPARLGAGTANVDAYLRGDGTWARLKKTLAEKKTGLVVAANRTNATFPLTFPEPFPAPPVVVVNTHSAVWDAYAIDVLSTGFTIYAFTRNGGVIGADSTIEASYVAREA